MIKVKQFCFNPFAVSAFILSDSDTAQAVAIDPGMISDSEREEFDKYISDNNLKLTQIVNTHLHLDHCFGDNYVRDKYGVPVAAHADDAFLGETLSDQAARFGIRLMGNAGKVAIDVYLKDGDTINVGNYKLHVIHVPGHSPGSIALYSPDGAFLIAGDVLFRHSIGRTDLPGGNLNTLLDSIDKKIMVLPEDTKVLPGHDSFTTVGNEKRYNPYLK